MGKIKIKVADFLSRKGYDLGYTEDMLPNLLDLDIVDKNNIPVWEYMGFRSEKSYYTRNKGSALALKEVIEKYGMAKREYWEEK